MRGRSADATERFHGNDLASDEWSEDTSRLILVELTFFGYPFKLEKGSIRERKSKRVIRKVLLVEGMHKHRRASVNNM